MRKLINKWGHLSKTTKKIIVGTILFIDIGILILALYLGITLLQDMLGGNQIKVYIETAIFLIISIVPIALLQLLKYLQDRVSGSNKYRDYLVNILETGSGESDTYDQFPKIDAIAGSKAISTTKTDNKDIIALMLKNNDEITEYFKISKSQAKASFWFSVLSCIVGLVALIIGIYGILIKKDTSVSIISLISGSVSEIISGTVFWVHNKSALQLNRYYDALHENEKFLSAINIADKLSYEKRELMLMEIIKKQIGIKEEIVDGKEE